MFALAPVMLFTPVIEPDLLAEPSTETPHKVRAVFHLVAVSASKPDPAPSFPDVQTVPPEPGANVQVSLLLAPLSTEQTILKVDLGLLGSEIELSTFPPASP